LTHAFSGTSFNSGPIEINILFKRKGPFRNKDPSRINASSQWIIENFHCKNTGSLNNKVKDPKGINKHQEINKTLPTSPLTIFSNKTCKVTKTISAAVSDKKSRVEYQTTAITAKINNGLLKIFNKKFNLQTPQCLKDR
jgi:hypothetical protein